MSVNHLEYHRLLKRQLKKSGLQNDHLIDPNVIKLIDLVNASYKSFDEERHLNERAERISSQELSEINSTLVEKNYFLDSFNHGLAHDAKNHTANLKGLLKMFDKYKDNNRPEKLKVISDKLYRSVNQMNSLLDGFLFLSSDRINIEEDLQEIDSIYLQESILLEVDYLLINTRHSVDFNLDIDGLRFSQPILNIILVNLISNALKFSKADAPNCIAVSIKFDEENLFLTVADTGMGMNLEDENSTMFKLFDRRSNVSHIKGYGVGLYLIKNILDRNNGTIHIKSELRKGTKIDIVFPKHSKD